MPGIRFLSDATESLDRLTPDDVVILPAFGTTVELLEELVGRGTLVDTTCGSVLNVWKNVKRYADEGYTAIIHGKILARETRATASQALHAGGGAYLGCSTTPSRDGLRLHPQRRQWGRAPAAVRARRRPGFDPATHLQRIGCANQTTMLSSESLAWWEMFRQAMRDRYGDDQLPSRFRAFDTICSAARIARTR